MSKLISLVSILFICAFGTTASAKTATAAAPTSTRYKTGGKTKQLPPLPAPQLTTAAQAQRVARLVQVNRHHHPKRTYGYRVAIVFTRANLTYTFTTRRSGTRGRLFLEISTKPATDKPRVNDFKTFFDGNVVSGSGKTDLDGKVDACSEGGLSKSFEIDRQLQSRCQQSYDNAIGMALRFLS